MYFDIVFSNGSEPNFIAMAKKLGIKGLCLVNAIAQDEEIEVKQIQLAKAKEIFRAHDKKKISLAQCNEQSREIIGRYKPNIVYDLEINNEVDAARARSSGLDKAICQLARKNNVIIAFSLSNILISNDAAKLIGRMQQNIMLCMKYKVKTAVASFATNPSQMRAEKDVQALMLNLGMDPLMAKNSLNSVSELFRKL